MSAPLNGLTRWRVGDVTVTAVLESAAAFSPELLRRLVLPDATRSAIAAIPWLQPHWADAAGDMRFVTQAFLVESCGRRVLVDTCLGNDKERLNPAFHRLQTPFLERLAEAGASPEDIDLVLCTHLHFDHVGWNTRWDGAHWVPTFPRARYLFATDEWRHWGEDPRHAYVLDDSIRPVLDAGLVDLVETGHILTDEVRLLPTPGHTPGHVSVQIRSAGAEALITGDVLHHPCQVAHSEWTSPADHDAALASATRHALLADACARDVLVLGTHFAHPAAGFVRADGDGAMRLEPVAGQED